MRALADAGLLATFRARSMVTAALHLHRLAIAPLWAHSQCEDRMNNIIYIVGLVVVVLAVLYFFGLA